MRSPRLLVVLTLSTTFSLWACKPSEKSAEPATQIKTNSPAPQPNSGDSSVDADTYTVSLPTSETPLTIKPKPGYKINADFPHRAILSAGATQATASVDHTEKRLIFKTAAKDALPKTGVKAELSFSVCNDQMCKLYKETYAW